MTAPRPTGLKVDDPTRAERVPQSIPRSTAQAIPQDVPQEWREWSASDRATSFRLPPELLAELAGAAERTGVPQGQIVLVAVTSLLDEGDQAIVAGADRAARALAAGKRNARRSRGSKQR